MLTDTETHINIKNLFIEKMQGLFLGFFFKDTFKVFPSTEQLVRYICKDYFCSVNLSWHQYQLLQ